MLELLKRKIEGNTTSHKERDNIHAESVSMVEQQEELKDDIQDEIIDQLFDSARDNIEHLPKILNDERIEKIIESEQVSSASKIYVIYKL